MNMNRTFATLLFCLPIHSVAAQDDLNILTDQPGKQLKLLLKRQFSEQLDRGAEASISAVILPGRCRLPL